LPSHYAYEWNFDDCDYCRDPGNPCFNVPCTFAMYVVAQCGFEMHLPLYDNETANIQVKECISDTYVHLTANSTGGWRASGTNIQWEDCLGTDTRWNNQTTDISFAASKSLCGVYRVEFKDWGGFMWDFLANCNASATGYYPIYDNYDDAVAGYTGYPETGISKLYARGSCPNYKVYYNVVNYGCETVDIPICIRTSLGGSWSSTVPSVGPGETRSFMTDIIVSGCVTSFDLTVEVDCLDTVLECSEQPGAGSHCLPPGVSRSKTVFVNVFMVLPSANGMLLILLCLLLPVTGIYLYRIRVCKGAGA